QEVNLQTGGSGAAAMARGGLVYNMITRTGTNQVHGEALIAGSTPGMDFPNFSSDLKAQLLATVPASALAANPNLSPGAKTNQHRIVGHRNDSGGTFASSQARNINDKYPDAHQVKFTTPWRGNKVLDVSFNRFRAADRFRPTAGTAPDAIAKVETTSNTVTDATPRGYNVKPQFRDQFQVSASYFTVAHDFLLGYQIFE